MTEDDAYPTPQAAIAEAGQRRWKLMPTVRKVSETAAPKTIDIGFGATRPRSDDPLLAAIQRFNDEIWDLLVL